MKLRMLLLLTPTRMRRIERERKKAKKKRGVEGGGAVAETRSEEEGREANGTQGKPDGQVGQASSSSPIA